MELCNGHVLTQVTVTRSKMHHLNYEYIIIFHFFNEKEGKVSRQDEAKEKSGVWNENAKKVGNIYFMAYQFCCFLSIAGYKFQIPAFYCMLQISRN
jgi:hypothetical protein